MNTNRGIFDSFPNQTAGRQDSPFSVAPEAGQAAVKDSPFAIADERPISPFTVVDEGADSKSSEFGKPVKLPERRKVDSPFQVAEPSEGFGFEAAAPAPAATASPFETAAAFPSYPPLSTPAQPLAASPFSVEAQPAASSFETPAEPAFKPWHESAPSVTQAPAQPAQIPSAFAPAPPAPAAPQAAAAVAAAVATQATASEYQSDSSSIRQLELRAIFGVDRELSAEEILQRGRALPGIRGLTRVAPREMVTVEGLKTLLAGLGFNGGPLKLYSGSTPLEFIREGPVLLAVQTDGGFAPGVRETLMIVARELSRIS